MRIRGLQARARPFRYAGFWLMAVACLLLIDSERSPWQVLIGCCSAGWPLLVDRCLTRWHARQAGCGASGGCATWRSARWWRWCWAGCRLPPLPAMTTVLWLLGGAAALAGWPLALAGSAAIAVGAGLGQAVGAGADPGIDTKCRSAGAGHAGRVRAGAGAAELPPGPPPRCPAAAAGASARPSWSGSTAGCSAICRSACAIGYGKRRTNRGAGSGAGSPWCSSTWRASPSWLSASMPKRWRRWWTTISEP
jgi:hypothetical protein